MAVPRAAKPPRVIVSVSLEPSTHSFSSPEPPKLSLTATLYADDPITVLTWHTVLYLPLALNQNAFEITDLQTSKPVQQHVIALSRTPIRRQLGGPDDQYFLTLHPNVPVTLSTGFGYPTGTLGKPLPKGDEGRLRPASQGRKVARGVCGVDGLEAGRKYRLEMMRSGDEHEPDGMSRVWWRWGTKEDVLDQKTGEGRGVLGEADEEGALVIEVEGNGVEFETVE
jgi:hypothetical protein